MIDPVKGKMEANADRAREKMEKREQRLENRAMLSETRARPGLVDRIRRAWASIRGTR
jgi:hypothetical protein